MKRTERVQRGRGIRMALSALLLAVMIGFGTDGLAVVSHAQSQGQVTAASAKIRKEPGTGSEVIGSVQKDNVITINSQVQGSDGYIWYQTFVNADTLGYIRSDLVTITDGSVPPTVTPVEPTTNTDTGVQPTEVQTSVTAVNPVSATVTGGASVRIRSDASTTGQIVTTASNGLVLTVTGTAAGADGKTWYQVNFNENGTDVAGFIRSDFVSLSGELTPYVEETPQPEAPVEEQPQEPVPEETPQTVTKDYDTALVDGEWYLVDYIKNEQQSISGIFNAVETNAKAYDQVNKTAKTQKVIIIILVLLLVAAAAGIAVLILKIRDMRDDAYFRQVEKETLRRRSETGRGQAPQKVMHTVGAEKGSRPGKPSGAQQTRPAGASGAQQTKPAGARPSGAQQTRPAGASGAQQTKPAGAGASGVQQTKPAGARPSGAQQTKPSGAGAAQSAKQGKTQPPKSAKTPQTWQSKNFMADEDDEFEFEFLNYDGEDE